MACGGDARSRPSKQTAVLAGKAPANPVRFAGQYLDATGLYNLRARLYKPSADQFTTLDPLVDTTRTRVLVCSKQPAALHRPQRPFVGRLHEAHGRDGTGIRPSHHRHRVGPGQVPRRPGR